MIMSNGVGFSSIWLLVFSPDYQCFMRPMNYQILPNEFNNMREFCDISTIYSLYFIFNYINVLVLLFNRNILQTKIFIKINLKRY